MKVSYTHLIALCLLASSLPAIAEDQTLTAVGHAPSFEEQPSPSEALPELQENNSQALSNLEEKNKFCLTRFRQAMAHNNDRHARLRKIQSWVEKEQAYRDSFRQAQESFATRLLTDVNTHLALDTKKQIEAARQAVARAETWERTNPKLLGGTHDNRLRNQVIAAGQALRPLLERDFHEALLREAKVTGATIARVPTDQSGKMDNSRNGQFDAEHSFELTLPMQVSAASGEARRENVRLRLSLDAREGEDWRLFEKQANQTEVFHNHGPTLSLKLRLKNLSLDSQPPQEIQESIALITRDASLLPAGLEDRYANNHYGIRDLRDLATEGWASFHNATGELSTRTDWNTIPPKYFHLDTSHETISRKVEGIKRSYRNILFLPEEDCVRMLRTNPPAEARSSQYRRLVAVPSFEPTP